MCRRSRLWQHKAAFPVKHASIGAALPARVGVCVICPVFRLDMSVGLSGCVSTDAFSSGGAFRPAFVARLPLKAAPAPPYDAGTPSLRLLRFPIIPLSAPLTPVD